MKLEILTPGPLSTIQDLGRFGYMQSGFSPGGAMDTHAAKTANLLVGNAMGDAVIEMTMMGIKARFDCDTVIALTGADMAPLLNDEPIPLYQSVAIHDGDVLTMSAAVSGMRGYLAVAGGFDLPVVMGSLSTNLKCAIGGFEGRKLKAGDTLPLRRRADLSQFGERRVPSEQYGTAVCVRAVAGPQDDYFTDEGVTTFFSKEYRVSAKSDRMGIRLEGDKVESRDGVDIVSDGIVTGSVQIPSDGHPIVMMADRQTTGGYAKIASVITPDLKLLAQLQPGNTVRFVRISQREAEKINVQEQQYFKQLEYAMMFER